MNEKTKTVTIIVNGRPHEIEKKEELTFQEVVVIALGSYEESETTAYTVTYTKNKHGETVYLEKGEEVKVKDEMIFNVTRTDKS
ncbi:multiubiquitin domain-containing protein [Paenibacillus sp. DMB5]|uniref:multiubiquitin domain-containing protein n=1 Tax=Paenibacillus sp. DMB5 TaxID=1780103 RepID=UPI00076CDD12|nr:multiubiquitin domain-containing protein [Paenibacillus sp. DMB5]KUP23679.1 hypothetical protein AWJ19_09475 [Paenibacillus sp. DMB5]